MSISKVNKYLYCTIISIAYLLCNDLNAQFTSLTFELPLAQRSVFPMPDLTFNESPLPTNVLFSDLDPSSFHYQQVQNNIMLGTREYGWFCKAEWEFEKKVKLPVRFRLGSLKETNRLEGK